MRRDINRRKKDKDFRIYHVDMYASEYWENNEHLAHKSFENLVKEMEYESVSTKLRDSCEVLKRKVKFRK